MGIRNRGYTENIEKVEPRAVQTGRVPRTLDSSSESIGYSRRSGEYQTKEHLAIEGKRLLDFICVLLAAVIAFHTLNNSFSMPSSELLVVIVFAFIFTSCGSFLKLNLNTMEKPFWFEIGSLMMTMVATTALLIGILHTTKTLSEISEYWIWFSLILSFAFMSSIRVMRRIYLYMRIGSNVNVEQAIVVGTGVHALEVAKVLKGSGELGIKVIGLIHCDNDPQSTFPADTDLPILGGLDELSNIVYSSRRPSNEATLDRVDHVWIALRLQESDHFEKVKNLMLHSSVKVSYIPDLIDLSPVGVSPDSIKGMPVINLAPSPVFGLKALFKRCFDIVFSIVAIILFAPVMLAIFILIKRDSSGPALFKQSRYGLDGKEIDIWKFRTMSVMENGANIQQAKRGDARVTAIGKVLRRTSLDELPQFFNVLQGSMSVVGPRPHAIAHNEYYRHQIGNYMRRHIVLPGITGWAQINGARGETDTKDKMERRVELDLEYIRNWTPQLDIYIILLTVVRGFYDKNAY